MFPGERDQWRGFMRFTFQIEGRTCYIVPPKAERPGRPWLWRARFWDAFPAVDIAMVEAGYHLVHIDIADLFGSPKAVRLWDLFYTKLTGEFGFAKKALLEGMSRGGLVVVNWAKANPEKVAAVYIDNPVCDFKSWPGGKGKAPGDAGCWQKCLAAYGLTEEEALRYPGNPADSVAPLGKARVPLLVVQATADKVVPMEENAVRLIAAYNAAGGKAEVIWKEGFDHHPHGLENPEPITSFLIRHSPGS